MARLQSLQNKRHQILSLAQEHGMGDVRIFGSVLRGEDTEQSDVDVLVHLDTGRTYFDFLRLKRDLEEEIGCSSISF